MLTLTEHKRITRTSHAHKDRCALGRLTSIDNNAVTTSTYIYNSTTHELDTINHIYNGSAYESLDYTYDNAGMVNSLDRTNMSVVMPTITNAVYDEANRLVRFDGDDITYDKNGNPLEMDGMNLTWNQKGQLTGVVNAPGGTVSYKYDALGRRVAKTVDGVTTSYLYDGQNIVAEMNGQGTVMAWYVHAGLDRPLARIAEDGTVHYYHTDLLGSVIALTDSSGTVTTQYNYSPFGETVVTGTDIDQPFRFTAREYDAETDMYYYRARYYSPDKRRFISQDPLRFAAGDVNFYAYVGNNPVNFVDPMGEAWIGRRGLQIFGIDNQVGFISHTSIILDDGTIIGYYDDDEFGKEGVREVDHIATPNDYQFEDRRDDYMIKNDTGIYDDNLIIQAVNNIKKRWESVRYSLAAHNCHYFIDAVMREYRNLLSGPKEECQR